MAQKETFDLRNNVTRGNSINVNTSLTGTTVANGSGVDTQGGVANAVHGYFAVGASSGSPDSFAITCELQESDTSAGTYTTVANSTALSLTASNTVGFVRGLASKRFVRCIMTPSFTGGTGPAIPAHASVMFPDKSF